MLCCELFNARVGRAKNVSALCALLDEQKAAFFQDRTRCQIIFVAFTDNFADIQIVHNDRQERLNCLRSIAISGVRLCDMITDFPGFFKWYCLNITDVFTIFQQDWIYQQLTGTVTPYKPLKRFLSFFYRPKDFIRNIALDIFVQRIPV